MGSDPQMRPLGLLRRVHALRLEFAEWLVLLFVGLIVSAGTGYNLLQFLLHGRFYIVRRRADYWAYWSEDSAAITFNGLYSALLFLGGGAAVLTALAYPILVWRWGKSTPEYLRKPPLSLRDD